MASPNRAASCVNWSTTRARVQGRIRSPARIFRKTGETNPYGFTRFAGSDDRLPPALRVHLSLILPRNRCNPLYLRKHPNGNLCTQVTVTSLGNRHQQPTKKPPNTFPQQDLQYILQETIPGRFSRQTVAKKRVTSPRCRAPAFADSRKPDFPENQTDILGRRMLMLEFVGRRFPLESAARPVAFAPAA